MALTKTPDARFANDKEQSERSARAQLQFITQHESSLVKIMNGRKYAIAASDLNSQKELFTDKQKSYIDVIYEKTMKALGLPHYSGTFKPRRNRI